MCVCVCVCVYNMYLYNDFVSEPDNMDAMELDYRVRLAEIQRKYKEKQKQLAKLHKKG